MSCLFHFFLWSIFCESCAWRHVCPGSSAYSSVKETSYEWPGSPREDTTPSKGSCSRKHHCCCHLFTNYFIHNLPWSLQMVKWYGKLLMLPFQIPQWRIQSDLPLALKIMSNLFQEDNLSPVSLLLWLRLCSDDKFSNLSETLWRYLGTYFFPIQSSSV